MKFAELHSHLLTEAALFRTAVIKAGNAKVPSCPDWDAVGLLDHVTEVYDDKTYCMREGKSPENFPPFTREGSSLERFDAALADLLAEFNSRKPEDSTFTWYDPDQSIGFWIRRMACETLVHRHDANLAAGESIASTDTAFELDALDELLYVWFQWNSQKFNDFVRPTLEKHNGLSIAVQTGDIARTITIAPEGIKIAEGLEGNPDATISGSSTDVLTWLYRRTPVDSIAIEGYADKAIQFYEILQNFEG